MNFVFNQGPSNVQTEDVTFINKTSFFEVTTQTNKYQVRDVTEQYLPYLDDDDDPIPGDVNGDREVTIADANAVINMILTGNFEAVGDVDGDGEVTISDVNFVINLILSN